MTDDELSEFAVPYEVTLRGTIIIEAKDAEHAKMMAEQSPMQDEMFYRTAETSDWGVTGPVKPA